MSLRLHSGGDAVPFFSGSDNREEPIQKLPASVDELIDELDRMIPEVIPATDARMIEIQRYAGKRELVVLLKTLRARRNGPPREQKRKR